VDENQGDRLEEVNVLVSSEVMLGEPERMGNGRSRYRTPPLKRGEYVIFGAEPGNFTELPRSSVDKVIPVVTTEARENKSLSGAAVMFGLDKNGQRSVSCMSRSNKVYYFEYGTDGKYSKHYLPYGKTHMTNEANLVVGIEIGGRTAYRLQSGQLGGTGGGAEMDVLITPDPRTETLD